MDLTERSVAPPPAWTLSQRLTARFDGPALSAWLLAFASVTYLALRNGGYDTVVRSEVGVAIWWIILFAAIAGLIPRRIPTAGWVAIGLLGAFTVWTTIGLTWTENSERTVVEIAREATYLGLLVLAIALQGRTSARHTVNGIACAIGLITVLAVLSRLHPQAFPPGQHFRFLGAESARKLSYPLNYWNGLAAFAAMGVPPLLAVAIRGRTLLGQAVAAAVLPLSALCVYLTISRGGVIALAAGIIVFLALVPRRLDAFATLAIAAIAGGILVWATSQRSALTEGLPTPLALQQGNRVLVLAVILCVGVALLQVAVALAARTFERPWLLDPGRRATAQRVATLLAIGAVVCIAVGVPGKVEHAWHDFKQPYGVVKPGSVTSVFTRFSAANGNNRYQFWQAAVHASEAHPWNGIGPGTYQFWWERHSNLPGFVRNAHSLYFETLAETGIIGIVLLGGLMLWFAAVAVRRSLVAARGLRVWIAGAAGGLTAFLVAAAVEWVWQLAAVAAAALVLGAVIVAGREAPDRAPAPDAGPRPARRRWIPRVVLAVAAIPALIAILIPLGEATALLRSQQAARVNDLHAALVDATTAANIEPYSGAPHLQIALVLEAAGHLDAAADAARTAASDAPTDYQTWLTLARIDARRGATAAALAEFRHARSLNPQSALFKT